MADQHSEGVDLSKLNVAQLNEMWDKYNIALKVCPKTGPIERIIIDRLEDIREAIHALEEE